MPHVHSSCGVLLREKTTGGRKRNGFIDKGFHVKPGSEPWMHQGIRLADSSPMRVLIAHLIKNLPAMQETPVWFLGREDLWRRDRLPNPVFLAFLVTQVLKTPPALWETWV